MWKRFVIFINILTFNLTTMINFLIKTSSIFRKYEHISAKVTASGVAGGGSG